MNILPVIYLRGGKAVTKAGQPASLAGGDPIEAARALALVGEIYLVDLDAEAGTGSNTSVIKDILCFAECRVGGGINSINAALDMLDIGAYKAVFSGDRLLMEDQTAIPTGRTVVQLDVSGLEDGLFERIEALRVVTGEVLLCFPGAAPWSALEALHTQLKASKTAPTVTVASSSESEADVLRLDGLGMQPQVGEALLLSTLSLGDLVVAFTRTDRVDGLYTTVVVDEMGVALGLVYSDDASIRAAVGKRKGVYHSRRRGLWEKGLSSGATQDLLGVSLDCDRDALRYVVHQHGAGFCHLDRRTCWCEDWGVGKLMRTLKDRVDHPDPKSYTNRLLNDKKLLQSKLLEEAQELIDADMDAKEVSFECADVVYFASVCLARAGVPWEAVEKNLDNKSRRIRRRKGDAKPDKPKPAAAPAPAPVPAPTAVAAAAPTTKSTAALFSARDLIMLGTGAVAAAAVLLARPRA